MRLFRFACEDCGATRDCRRPCDVARIARAHRCDQTCAAGCGRKAAVASRGLCRACHADLDIRVSFGISFNRSADLIEDAEWLADDDANLTQALARLGVKRDALWQACKRAGRRDLYMRLAEREPNGEMRRKVSASAQAKKRAA